MMAILFKKVRWKNLLSTGNTFTEIDLCRSTNTLIVGKNGAGKSTILDALCFGLFGKAFRNINKNNLINSINNSHCEVEVEFTIGKKQYKILRGIKPNKFEIYCDGQLINQDAKIKDYQDHLEKNILKLNFKSFTQVVILGSASFVPFMQLSAADRRSIIEELLDIKIFSTMNVLVKDKLNLIKDDLKEIKYGEDLIKEKIKLQKIHIEENNRQKEEEIKRKQKEIDIYNIQIQQFNEKIELIQKHIEQLQKKIQDKSKVSEKIKKLLQLEAKIENNIQKVCNDIDFYEKYDNCPTCKQTIEEQFKQSEIIKRKEKQEEIKKGLKDIEKEIEKLNKRTEEIQEITNDIVLHNNEIVKHNSTIKATNNLISKLNKEISEILSKKDSLEYNGDDGLKILVNEQKSILKKQQKLTSEKYYYEYSSNLLKDTGIKTRIIRQYLPIMNKLINKYLSAMDFYVNFNIDENFKETIKSRHRDQFTYESFSEGEKQKLDLAILFTWRQIAKLKNSTNTNLLILDEVFDSSLDGTSVELLMNLIQEFSDDTNVFVISHKSDVLFDKFRSVISYNKKGNFSIIEEKK